MKKLYYLSLLIGSFSFAQVSLPHYEGFDYPDATALQTQTGYSALNSGDDLLVSSGSLTYTGLASSTGNKLTFAGAGIDATKAITSQTSGTVYYSLLLNINTMAGITDPDAGYFVAFAENGTTYGATLWSQRGSDDNSFKLGIETRTASGASISYTTDTYTTGTTYFVVVSYTFGSNASDDEVKLWVNPVPGQAEPTATVTDTHAGTDLNSIESILIRQDSTTETPDIQIDELRIGTTWADVTPEATAPTKDFSAIDGLKMYPNPVSGNELNFASRANAKMSVQIFDILGKEVLKSNVVNNKVNIARLNSGVYIVKVTEEGKTATRKLVIQ